MIERSVENQIKTALKFFPCVTLTGARQTGKTTLLRNILPEYNYISLDLPSIAAMAEETPEVFFEKYKTPLIIDEVQYSPKLFRYLKDKIDQDRHSMGQIVLTGSQKFELMKDLSESLAGRTAVLELEGLSWQEYSNSPCFNDSNKTKIEEKAQFRDFVFRGGFPELTRQLDFPEDMFFSSYLATYLERDVRQLINVTSLRTFEQFIRLLAVRNSQQLDMSCIANALGINAKSDDAKNLKKMSDILSDSKNIPPELQPVSYSIACNTPADYKFSLAPDKEHKLDITVLNVKEAGKTYF